MKYLRTEYSFDPSEIDGLYLKKTTHTLNPTFSVIWIKTSTNYEISLDKIYNEFALPHKGRLYNISGITLSGKTEALHHFIDHSLRFAGAASPIALRQLVTPNPAYIFSKDPEIENPAIINYICREGFVVERSPPEWMSMSQLLDKSSSAAGVSLAFLAVTTNQWLLFAAIPGGVVLMGAAVGVAKGLQAGLHHSIERYLKKRLK
jgi:hypothetical protein